MRQKELAIRLSKVRPNPAPRASLEQYATPSEVAADMLYRALSRGDIQGRRVADLGCGTGILGIGAALLGATSVVGVDVDPEAVAMARSAAADLGVEASFVEGTVEAFDGRVDTVVMNPPFGAQWSARGADARFLRRALELADGVYSLHLAKTVGHLVAIANEADAGADVLTSYRFALPHQHAFHTREKVDVEVALLTTRRKG